MHSDAAAEETSARILRVAREQFREDPLSSGFFFDFDGVLSPIQDDPAASKPVSGFVALINELSDRAGKVAIISARPVNFLARALSGLKGCEIYGAYGIQKITADGERRDHPDVQLYLEQVRKAVADALAIFPSRLVEDKETSVSVHYRTAPSMKGDVEVWAEQQEKVTGLRRQGGRMVEELKMPIPQDKGSIVEREIHALRSAWYFGDDVGDIPAFRMIELEARNRPNFVGIRVGVLNDDPVESVLKNTDIQVGAPAELLELLRGVVSTSD